MARTEDTPMPHRATVLVASGRGAAERWFGQYCRDGRWLHPSGADAEAIHKALVALGDNPDPAAVEQVVGNRSWSFIRCDACAELVERAVRLGQGYSDSDPVLCRACCFEGALALIAPRTDKTNALDESTPHWRTIKHDNGAPRYAKDGTMLDDRGNRSIFDDVDE